MLLKFTLRHHCTILWQCWSRESYFDTTLTSPCQDGVCTCAPLDRRRCIRWWRRYTGLHSDTCSPRSRHSPAHSPRRRSLEYTHTWDTHTHTELREINSCWCWIQVSDWGIICFVFWGKHTWSRSFSAISKKVCKSTGFSLWLEMLQ